MVSFSVLINDTFQSIVDNYVVILVVLPFNVGAKILTFHSDSSPHLVSDDSLNDLCVYENMCEREISCFCIFLICFVAE